MLELLAEYSLPYVVFFASLSEGERAQEEKRCQKSHSYIRMDVRMIAKRTRIFPQAPPIHLPVGRV